MVMLSSTYGYLIWCILCSTLLSHLSHIDAKDLSECGNWDSDDCIKETNHPKYEVHCHPTSTPGQYLPCKELCGWNLTLVSGHCEGYCPEFITECLKSPVASTSTASTTALNTTTAFTPRQPTTVSTTTVNPTALITMTYNEQPSTTMHAVHQPDLPINSTNGHETSEQESRSTILSSTTTRITSHTKELADAQTIFLIVISIIQFVAIVTLFFGFKSRTFKRRICYVCRRCSCRRKQRKIDAKTPTEINMEEGAVDSKLDDIPNGCVESVPKCSSTKKKDKTSHGPNGAVYKVHVVNENSISTRNRPRSNGFAVHKADVHAQETPHQGVSSMNSTAENRLGKPDVTAQVGKRIKHKQDHQRTNDQIGRVAGDKPEVVEQVPLLHNVKEETEVSESHL